MSPVTEDKFEAFEFYAVGEWVRGDVCGTDSQQTWAVAPSPSGDRYSAEGAQLPGGWLDHLQHR